MDNLGQKQSSAANGTLNLGGRPAGRNRDSEGKAMSKKPMKSDAQARHDKLCYRILARMEAEGQERNGYRWALFTRQELAEALDVDAKTISRLIQVPPIQCFVTAKEDATGKWRRVLALRVAEVGEPPAQPNPRDIANIMRNLFVAKTGRAPGKDEYGCLIGLAKEWPEGHQVAIFKDVLAEWGSYMAAIKNRIDFETEALEVKGLRSRYYRFPTITLLRRWPHVVADAYLTRWQMQHNGKPNVPPQPFAYHYDDASEAA